MTDRKLTWILIIYFAWLFYGVITLNDFLIQSWGLIFMGLWSYTGIKGLKEFYKEFFSQGIKKGLWRCLKSPLDILFVLINCIIIPIGFVYLSLKFLHRFFG